MGNIELKTFEDEYMVKVKGGRYVPSFANEEKEVFNNIKSFIENGEKKYNFEKQLEEIKSNYNLEKFERYNFILNKIIEEEKLYLYKDEEKFIVNAEKMAMKNLEIFKTMNFEEIDFYVFYVEYLSKKNMKIKKY